MWSQRSEVVFLKGQDDRFSVSWSKCGLQHPFMSRRLSRLLHQKYFLCAPSTTSLLVTIIGASIYHNYIFSCFFVCFVFTSSCFFSLDKALLPVPEKCIECTGSEGLRRFAPCEGCSQGVVLGRNWFNRSPTTSQTATDFFSPVGARGLCNCVTAFRVSSSAAGFSCTGLKRHEDYGFNTAKRNFIHVCLLIALFSILGFGCLESDDRSCGRLRHCLLVNSSIK